MNQDFKKKNPHNIGLDNKQFSPSFVSCIFTYYLTFNYILSHSSSYLITILNFYTIVLKNLSILYFSIMYTSFDDVWLFFKDFNV